MTGEPRGISSGGYSNSSIELKKVGKDIPVTLDNLEEYLQVGTVTGALS